MSKIVRLVFFLSEEFSLTKLVMRLLSKKGNEYKKIK